MMSMMMRLDTSKRPGMSTGGNDQCRRRRACYIRRRCWVVFVGCLCSKVLARNASELGIQRIAKIKTILNDLVLS